ncbi:MAG: hypothetical protein IJI14_13440 [Anaerolineaceae bacterium]|nr:hypothetical protein [Anaerolineaceae bacterium]
MLSIQKASGRPSENSSGQPEKFTKTGNQYKNAFSGQVEKAPTKSETVSEMGYSKDQVSEYQRLAQNPDIVQVEKYQK